MIHRLVLWRFGKSELRTHLLALTTMPHGSLILLSIESRLSIIPRSSLNLLRLVPGMMLAVTHGKIGGLAFVSRLPEVLLQPHRRPLQDFPLLLVNFISSIFFLVLQKGKHKEKGAKFTLCSYFSSVIHVILSYFFSVIHVFLSQFIDLVERCSKLIAHPVPRI